MQRRFGRRDRGGIAFMFALTVVPITMVAGLAIDYSFFISSRAQLNLAADAAAMHAVRVATLNYSAGQNNSANATAAGIQAGKDWFVAQLGSLNTAQLASGSPTVSVSYTASPSAFSSTVTYKAAIDPFFSSLFNSGGWTVSGNSQAVISNSYVEIVMLLDNSPSMLLGSSVSDILTMEQNTMCSTKTSYVIDMGQYIWNYPTHNPPYGFITGSSTNFTTPQSSANFGSCDTRYDGSASLCFNPMTVVNSTGSPLIGSNGRCTNGGGATVNGQAHVPVTPCGFACHNDAGNNDFYGLARQLGVTLRLDVVQNAAANVIQTLLTDEEAPQQFTVGIYQFATGVAPLYPSTTSPSSTGSTEAGPDLSTAQTLISQVKNNPPLTSDVPDTNFTTAMTALQNYVNVNTGSTWTGQSAATPSRALFIVTDGMSDTTNSGGSQVMAAFNPASCQAYKNAGFNVFVLYTPYLPVPVQSYLSQGRLVAEPSGASPILTALQSCATVPANFFQASSATDINNAMQAMLASAVDSAGRISH